MELLVDVEIILRIFFKFFFCFVSWSVDKSLIVVLNSLVSFKCKNISV